jgi:AraC-like DNA-binding protein
MTVGFSTAEAARGERIDYWREMVDRYFVPLQVEPRNAREFAGAARLRSVDEVEVARVRAHPMTVRRSQRHIGYSAREEYFLALHLRGLARVQQDGRCAVLGPGDFALLDGGRPYMIEFWDAAHFEHLILRVPRVRLDPWSTDLDRATALAVRASSAHGRIVSGGLRAAASSRAGPELMDPMLELLARALRGRSGIAAVPESRNAQALFELKRYALSHVGDGDLSPASAAGAAWISVRQLHRIFASDGTTFARFVRNARLQRCRRDLTDPHLAARSIAEIGARWGFPSPAHFTRAFAARYGCTPRQVRQSSANCDQARNRAREDPAAAGVWRVRKGSVPAASGGRGPQNAG